MYITKEKIEKSLPHVEVGLKKYKAIQDLYLKTNVTTDRNFQKLFNHFYKVRRGVDWQQPFFEMLERGKNETYTFDYLLTEIHRRTGRFEASFASKLLATIDDKRAVLDSFVLKNLGLKLPYSGSKDRTSKVIETYNQMESTLNKILESNIGNLIEEAFDNHYPDADISKMKKLDLVLWQMR